MIEIIVSREIMITIGLCDNCNASCFEKNSDMENQLEFEF